MGLHPRPACCKLTRVSANPDPSVPGAKGDANHPLWKVRGEDGSIFGPASLASLQAWARDGRLAPNHVISSDGQSWMPVTRLAALEMNWVVEVSPGTFYGPIHLQALEELIREGSIARDARRYACPVRLAKPDADLKTERDTLVRRVETLRTEFAQRAGAVERQLRDATAACERLQGELGTKDLEFEAERQAFRAAASRHQADLARAKADCAALEARLAQAAQRDTDFAAATAKITELESQLAEVTEHRQALEADWTAKLQEARQAAHAAEKALLAERASQAQRVQEWRQQGESLKAARLRQESARKLLLQASSLLDTPAAAPGDTVIEDGVAIMMEQTPPPRPGLVLGQLEAQAQREINRLGRQPANLFGRRK